jgi:hypothetical protein
VRPGREEPERYVVLHLGDVGHVVRAAGLEGPRWVALLDHGVDVLDDVQRGAAQ